MKILIWWLDQDACEANGDLSDTNLPTYIKRQYSSRQGRAGRGRLWSDKIFDKLDPKVEPWPTDKPASDYAARSGGIVIKETDAPVLRKYKGMITDTSLDLR